MSRPEEGIQNGTVLLGKYRVDERIGRGGMGLVYRAHHLALDEQVAIKILRADVQLDEEAVQRFQREAQAAVRLKSEHVARISDVGTFDDGSPYMVMEFLAGADLGTIVDTNGPMHVGDAVDLILQACDALAEAHSLNIIHRDVKPSNLFVTTRPDGAPMVKILDFGISKSAHGTDLSLTQTASVLGTPAYMSPEQMRSARRVDGRTDIWSLGTVLYELVEGRRPFLAETFSEMCVMAAADPHEPMQSAPQLEQVIARCLAKTPEGRYPTMAELARDLAPFASDLQRAQFYVLRIHRVLGRALDRTTPTSMPAVRPTPLPGRMMTPRADTDGAPSGPVTLSTVGDPPMRSRRKIVIAAALISSLIAVAVATILLSSTKPEAAAEPVADEGSNDVVTMPSHPPPGSAAAGSGSTGSADAAVGSAKAGSGSGRTIKRPPPVIKRGSGAIAKGNDTKKGSADTKKGSAATAGSGSAALKKKCDPFASARPCPKE